MLAILTPLPDDPHRSAPRIARSISSSGRCRRRRPGSRVPTCAALWAWFESGGTKSRVPRPEEPDDGAEARPSAFCTPALKTPRALLVAKMDARAVWVPVRLCRRCLVLARPLLYCENDRAARPSGRVVVTAHQAAPMRRCSGRRASCRQPTRAPDAFATKLRARPSAASVKFCVVDTLASPSVGEDMARPYRCRGRRRDAGTLGGRESRSARRVP